MASTAHARLADATAVDFRGVSVSYGRADPVLLDVSLSIQQGEFVAVAGPNGGGKTTLLRAMVGLIPVDQGDVQLYGEPVAQFRQRKLIGYLRQRAEVGVEAPVTVGEVVAAGRLATGRRIGPMRAADRAAVDKAIERVGLSDRTRTPIKQLSGGQQQRVFLAKLLAGDPALVLLDEPTTGVDAKSQEAFAELLCDLNDRLGVTIIYVSHEFAAVEMHVDRLILVNGGITFDGEPADLPGAWHDPSHDHSHTHTHQHGGDE